MINTPLRVWDHQNGDPGCSAAAQRVQQAINEMNQKYQGLNLTYAGTHNFNTSCSGGSATGNDMTSYMNNQLNGSRNLIIQYNDPCNEMSISGCSGVLAYGGLYWSGGTHNEFGETWYNGAYGYVVINNNVGQCYCNSIYDETLIHEMSHSLGIGHISFGAGQANMNPSGPGAITNLDIACLDYAYQPGQSQDPGCETILSLEFQTYQDQTILQASDEIHLSNISVLTPATLTLDAPVVEIDQSMTISPGANLVIESEGCN